MVDKWKVGDIGVQGGVTHGLAKVKWNKIIKQIETKKSQNAVLHTSK